jgi:hypothetical protein
VDLQGDLVARLVVGDQVGELGRVLHRLAGDLGDDVAARAVGLGLEVDRAAAAAQPRLLGGPAGRDLLHPGARVDIEIEAIDELRVQLDRRDPEIGVLRLAALAQHVERALDRVDRHREADALAAARGRLDLLIDADDLAVGVDERAAGVAGVDRRVGLDRTRDAEAGQRLDRAIDRRDHADRQRLALAERRSDRRHRLADLDVMAVAERQRPEREPLRVDLQQRDVRVRIGADDLGLDRVAVRELDVDLARPLERVALAGGDDVRVGGDLAVAVEHEPRPDPAAFVVAAERRPQPAGAEQRDHGHNAR